MRHRHFDPVRTASLVCRGQALRAWHRRLLLLAFFFGCTPAQLLSQDSEPAVQWQPIIVEAVDGSPIKGERTTIRVPERHEQSATRPGLSEPEIELAVARFRTTHPNPGPPIVFLAGGPGGSGIEGAAVVASHPQLRLLEHADVIGIDQRGTGRSMPNLIDHSLTEKLPLTEAVTRQRYIRALRKVAERTAETWRQRGVDLSAYNSQQSAEDIEAVRVALGLDRITLYGASYGTHLGLAYLRRYSDHVARAILVNTEGPDHTWKLPTNAQTVLQLLDDMLEGDPISKGRGTLIDRIAALLQVLERDAPLLETDEGPLRVTQHDLRTHLVFALGSVRELEELPAVLDQFENGDWSGLRETSLANHQVSYPAMALAMDCSSGASRQRMQRLKAEASSPRNLLGDTILMPLYPDACAGLAFEPLPAWFRSEIASDVPTLFVSGTLDPRTPPSNVDELLAGFTNGVHVLVENASHDSRQLMAREYRSILQAFLRGEDVQNTKLTLPEPIFRSSLD